MEIIKKDKVALFLPILFLILYFSADIVYDPNYIVYIKPFIIPSILLYPILYIWEKLTKNYFLFVSFFYINELFLLLWQDYIILYKIALISSFFCYLSLIMLGYLVLKNKKVYKIPKGFSLLIIFLNGILILSVVLFLILSTGDLYLNIIIGFNALIAIVLGVTAVLYISNFSDKKAYYYFFGSFALIISDVSGAIGVYFLDTVLLNSLDRILHFLAFYLVYLFIISETKKKNSAAY
jgi:hypothetical protein